MREILFRGKSNAGGWVYGVPLQIGEYCEMCYFNSETMETEYYLVIPETIGQYIGLTDKNGKKIFEGDIIKHNNYSDKGFDIGKVYWDETRSQWRRTSVGNFHDSSFTYVMSCSCEYEIIGNIHDNPELLKGGEG